MKVASQEFRNRFYLSRRFSRLFPAAYARPPLFPPPTMWGELESSDEIPGPRAAHSCDLIDNKLYVFGGWNGKKALNDLHILDIASMSWSEVMVVGVPPATRNNHTLSQVGTKLYIHGGHDGSKWLADMHILTLVSALNRAEWSQPMLSGAPPSARACHTTTRMGRKLYMFGGYDGTKCFNDVDVLDLETMTWIQPRVSGRLPQVSGEKGREWERGERRRKEG